MTKTWQEFLRSLKECMVKEPGEEPGQAELHSGTQASAQPLLAGSYFCRHQLRPHFPDGGMASV